jgi:hypothetical protein
MTAKPKAKASRKGRPKSSREKVQAYRARMRSQGLRPIQIWVPDTRSPEFAAEAHRQSLAISRSPQEKDDQAYIDSISILNFDEEG